MYLLKMSVSISPAPPPPSHNILEYQKMVTVIAFFKTFPALKHEMKT